MWIWRGSAWLWRRLFDYKAAIKQAEWRVAIRSANNWRLTAMWVRYSWQLLLRQTDSRNSNVAILATSIACNVNDDQCFEVFSKKNNKKWTCQCTEVVEVSKTSSNPVKADNEYENRLQDDPCEPYNPPVPDFSRPNRRLSITKCYEYIWLVQKRHEEETRAKDCRASRHKREVEQKENPLDNHALNILLDMNEAKTQVEETQWKLEIVTETDNKTDEIQDTLKPFKYILNGYDASRAEFPHMGAIGWKSVDEEKKWEFKCGSTLISPKFVLTAAHCSQVSSIDSSVTDVVPKIVRFGVEDISQFSVLRSPVDKDIIKIIVHPEYVSPRKYFDIALMQLDEEVAFTKFVRPACLWSGNVFDFNRVEVTGWGVTSKRALQGHPYLQAATLNIIDDNTCNMLLKGKCSRLFCHLRRHQFCAGQLAGGVDACQGDSGGPIQSKIPLPRNADVNMHYVIGVTAFGMGCGQKDQPGIYTKVSYFVDWIESIVWQ